MTWLSFSLPHDLFSFLSTRAVCISLFFSVVSSPHLSRPFTIALFLLGTYHKYPCREPSRLVRNLSPSIPFLLFLLLSHTPSLLRYPSPSYTYSVIIFPRISLSFLQRYTLLPIPFPLLLTPLTFNNLHLLSRITHFTPTILFSRLKQNPDRAITTNTKHDNNHPFPSCHLFAYNTSLFTPILLDLIPHTPIFVY